MGALDIREAELFGILAEVLADGDLDRDALRVKVGARGFDLGRPFLHLFRLGLVEERTVRPSFFRRLFGAPDTQQVRLTAEGRRVAAGLAGAREDLTAPEDLPVEVEIAPGSSAPAVPEEPEPAPAPVAVDASPQPAPEPAPPEDEVVPSSGPRVAVEPEPLVDAAPTVLEPRILDAPTVAPDVVTQDIPPTPARIKAPRDASSVPPSRRLTLSDFTETMGGAPVQEGFALPDSDRLEGLSELTGLLGFELADAGRLLAANRWVDGQSDSEVALEIVVTALAHAARLKATKTTDLDVDAALELVGKIREMFGVFVSEGMLGADDLKGAVRLMAAFLVDPTETSGLYEYLADPLRGLAPPAICPEGVYLLVNVED